MNIGQAANEADISAKMIRYYESIGLLPEAERRHSGYRDYAADDVSRLKFLKRARSLGFSVPQIQELMRLWTDRDRSNAEVRKLALDHAAELEAKALQLQEMIATLRSLASACKRGDRPDCPILTELGGSAAGTPLPKRTAKMGGTRAQWR
jgi:Cu(I)-responsive transcriptional regulator